jgi:signal peptidase I
MKRGNSGIKPGKTGKTERVSEKFQMKTILRWGRDLLPAILIAALLLVLFKPFVVRQSSMMPTFTDGDLTIVSRQAYRLFGYVERGDVVIFRTGQEAGSQEASGTEKTLIKRVIGLPGDRVEIIGGYVYLNGEKLEEPYVEEQGASGEMEAVTVPEGCMFVLGDNRRVSQDSRDETIGCPFQRDIIGKVVFHLDMGDRK